MSTPISPTKDYALKIEFEVGFEAVSDRAAHKIAAATQQAQRRAVDQALAMPHTVVVLDFDLAQKAEAGKRRFLRYEHADAAAKRAKYAGSFRAWLLNDWVPGLIAAVVLSAGLTRHSGFAIGAGILCVGFWLTDRIAARVARLIQRKS